MARALAKSQITTSIARVGLIRLVLMLGVSPILAPPAHAAISEEETGRLLAEAEPRIKAIYDTNDFSPRPFRATWSPDASGYMTLETPVGADAPEIVSYDAASGNLLIIVGTGETNTHLEVTEGLVDRLIELGKRFDYMAYPNRDHGLREGRGTEVHLRMLIIRYLIEHLNPGPR